MKFICNQEIILKSLNIVSKAITNRTTIPILKGILIEAENGKITLKSSDLDLSISNEIKCNTIENGKIVVMAKLFHEIIRKLPNKEITFELKENSLNITCENFDANIVSFSPEEFPRIQEIEENNKIIIDRELFKDMIIKTSFSASIDESKGVITGVLLELVEGNIKMVALDGFRMAVLKEKMKIEKENKIIISAKTMNEIYKIVSEYENEDIELIIDDKKAGVIIGNTKIVTRLLEGEFIKYNDILPKENKISVILNKKNLIESIERASLFSKEGKNNLIKLSIKENIIKINSTSEDGNIEEFIDVEKNGEDIEIGFNSKYVVDCLKVVEDDLIKMEFNNSVSPCLIKPLEDDSYTYLILPVRISGN